MPGRVGIAGGLGGWTISSCLQTLIFEWKSVWNFNPRAKFQTFRHLTPSSFRSIPTLMPGRRITVIRPILTLKLVAMATSLDQSEKNVRSLICDQMPTVGLWWKFGETQASMSWDIGYCLKWIIFSASLYERSAIATGVLPEPSVGPHM